MIQALRSRRLSKHALVSARLSAHIAVCNKRHRRHHHGHGFATHDGVESGAHHGAMQTPRLVDLEAGRSSCSWPSGSNSTNLDEPSVVRGKYRDEVEMAIQHALALSLPGARYKTIFPYGEVHGPTGVCRPATPVGQPHRKGAPPFGGRPCGAVVIVVPVQSRRTFDAFIGTLRTAIKMRNPLRTFSTSSYVRWSLS